MQPEISCEEFLDSGELILNDGKPLRLYPLQRRFVRDVFDTYDTVTERRAYRQALWSVPKKFGKSTLAAALGVWHLFYDQSENNREVQSLAGDLDQARLTLLIAQGMIRRSRDLSRLIGRGLYANEIVYEDKAFGQVHKWRAFASDVPTSHGLDPTLQLLDEGWQLRDYSLLEAFSLGPQRRHPLQAWFTYAGFQACCVEGNPLWDLYQRGLAESDPSLYFVWRNGLEAYDELPPGFIRDGYLDEQRRLLPANKFQRLHLNQWGAGDTAFASSEEIAEVFSQGLLRVAEDRVHLWVLTVDYGRSVDMSALVVARQREDRSIQVGELIVLKGSKAAPIPLETIEREVLSLSQRFRLTHIAADQWQMHASIERLKKIYGLRIHPVSIGPSYLNQITTNFLALLRSGRFHCFHHPEFRQQLESVIVKETFYGVRIDTGKGGAGVRAHDDMVIAAAMAAQLAIDMGGGPREILACIKTPTGPAPSNAMAAIREAKTERLRRQLVASGVRTVN